MKLKIEQWVEETHPFDDTAYDLFTESVNNYKIGSYKSAFIMSYLSFKLTIRNRIISCSYGQELKKKSPEFWESDILQILHNDDKWEEQINKIVNASCAPINSRKDIGILYFKNAESAKTEYNYWREKRNACVHGKEQIIDSSTVESFWNYLINNLSQFYVLGGEEYLVREFVETYKYYKYPDICRKNRVNELLHDIAIIFKRNTKEFFDIFLKSTGKVSHFIDDENRDFWDSIINFGQEHIADGLIRCISCNRELFFELYPYFPKILEMLAALDPKFIIETLSNWLAEFPAYHAVDNKIFWRMLVDSLRKYEEQVDINIIVCDSTFGLIKDFSDESNDTATLNKYGIFKKYLLEVSGWYFNTSSDDQYNNFKKCYNDFSDIEMCFSRLEWDADCLNKLNNALLTFKDSFPSRGDVSKQNGRAFFKSCQKIIQDNQEKIEKFVQTNWDDYRMIYEVIEGTYFKYLL